MIVAFLGFGTIAKTIYEEIESRKTGKLSFRGFYDPYIGNASCSASKWLIQFESFEELLASPVDIVVEAAS